MDLKTMASLHIILILCMATALKAENEIYDEIDNFEIFQELFQENADSELYQEKISSKNRIRRDLRFMELAQFDGYQAENHTVVTEDGYILTIFRVKSKCGNRDPEPIIFMHGLYLSADDCIMAGPGTAQCYMYADACKDVWVPNNRGNLYSRSHVSLNPNRDPRFWDFAFDEMAMFDTPAIIDYILKQTRRKQIAYVGHSQGVTNLLLLCAQRPEYNDKIKVGFGFSMTAWLNNARFIVLKIQKALTPILTPANNAGINMEFLPRDAFYQPIAKLLCGTLNASYLPCSTLYFSVLGYNRFQLTRDTFQVLTGHVPSGTSLKNFNRWGQIKKNGFTAYDYGVLGNLRHYRQRTPPEFDLSKVTMKWIFVTSLNDYVSDVRDIDILVPKVFNSTKCVVSDRTFGHLDYLFGRDIPVLITPMVLKYLDEGEYVCL